MPSTAVSELQQKLLKRMGLDVPAHLHIRRKGIYKKPTRLERRKQQRQLQKLGQKPSDEHGKPPIKSHRNERRSPSSSYSASMNPLGAAIFNDDDIENETLPVWDERNEDISECLRDNDTGAKGCGEKRNKFLHLGEVGTWDGNGEIEYLRGPVSGNPGNSEVLHRKLAKDDAEIEELERKLGIKKGHSSLPKAFKNDGLDQIIDDFTNSPKEESNGTSKRKRDYDDWLALKRNRTELLTRPIEVDNRNIQSIRSKKDHICDNMAISGTKGQPVKDGEAFVRVSSNEEGRNQRQMSRRENPYVAPINGAVISNYVPPSLRKTTEFELETRIRLQRRIQGLINRLTESNILSIVISTESLYQTGARGEVTEALTDIVVAQLHKPDAIPDQFFVLIGGFSAAIYKIVGSSFGSHLIIRVVSEFSQAYKKSDQNEYSPGARKVASNMLGFLTQLYLFEVVSCRIVFDYMEKLLADLSESNVELLLRVCQMAGRLLRRDDPHALKHVATILNNAILRVGYTIVSSRTKFMIEMINDLKNSKTKPRGIDSSVVSEHVLRMRKRLGELKAQSRRLEGLTPLGVGLVEIEEVNTQGQWWLVGASVPAKKLSQSSQMPTGTLKLVSVDLCDTENMDIVLPDYAGKARAQGFNTSAQLAIFTAIMSAANYEHGYRQYIGLGLKRDDQLEIAPVLVQCVGSESQYNEYYALVGKQACTNSKVRFAFQDRLWKLFRSLGEAMFGEEADDQVTADGERMKDERRISNVARFYANLISSGALSILVLKPLSLLELEDSTSLFVEWLVLSLLRSCQGKGSKEDAKIRDVFSAASRVVSLAAGLSWFLRERVQKSRLTNLGENRKLQRVGEKAQKIIQSQAEIGII